MSMEPKAVLIKNNLVSFSPDMAPQDIQDLMTLMMYAELSANTRFDQKLHTKRWMDHYQSRLVKYGCSLASFLAEDELTATDMHQMRGWLLQFIGTLGSEELKGLAMRSFEALRVDERAQRYLAASAASAGAGSAQVMKITPCQLTASGEVLVFFCGMRLLRSEHVESSWHWDDKMRYVSFIPNGGVYHFDRVAFAVHREKLGEALKRQSSDYFHEVGSSGLR